MPDVNDIKVDNLPKSREDRGNLVAAEFNDFVPFPVVRLFYVHDVPVNTIRGRHGHRRGRQYMICQTGRVIVEASDGKQKRQMELTAGQSILMEPGIFFSEKYVDPDTVLLILCDSPYDKNDYIESMDELSMARR